MAHDPSLGHADYVSAANAAATTLMPAMDEGGTELFGLQSGMEMLGMRGLAVMPGAMAGASAHSKPVLIDGASTISFLSEQHHQPRQAPLSLSLYGPEGVLHQHHGAISSSSPRQLLPAAWPYGSPHGAWHLRSSRFLLPAQQLLQEFCSLPVESTRPGKPKAPNDDGSDGGGRGSSSTTSWSQSPQIQAMDALDLQKLKDKLYIMLEEVDGRYRRYCEQMRGLVDAFEAVAGGRAAAVYTAQAARTMSRHFRNLRDGIVGQIQAVRKALGEKDTAVPGKTKGETPRLRALDQCLRQQRALHQAAMVESHPWRPQRGLPERAVSILRAWLFEHFLHPYPSDMDKHILARQTSLSRSQVSNWFINARVRLWKPMVEEMYKEEMKEQEGSHARLNPNPTSNTSDAAQDEDGADDEQKPTQAQLLHDTGSLASVVNATHGNRARGAPTRPMESFGIMDHLDFDPYDGGQGFSSGGVSLTLGLQQHDSHGSGVNVAFAAPAAGAHGGAGFLFPGEQMEGVHSGHDHHGQFGAGMEAEASHGQVHYRGLSTGFQLLRDLAG